MSSLPAGVATPVPDGLPITVHWVLRPFAVGSLLKLRPESTEQHVPEQGEVVRRPFLVDSHTRRPVRVRIVQRLDWTELDEPRCVVVVAPEAPAQPA
jgi:hypothetical protein